jgi:hypothetical protein
MSFDNPNMPGTLETIIGGSTSPEPDPDSNIVTVVYQTLSWIQMLLSVLYLDAHQLEKSLQAKTRSLIIVY